jgi:hypothetical protein
MVCDIIQFTGVVLANLLPNGPVQDLILAPLVFLLATVIGCPT